MLFYSQWSALSWENFGRQAGQWPRTGLQDNVLTILCDKLALRKFACLLWAEACFRGPRWSTFRSIWSWYVFLSAKHIQGSLPYPAKHLRHYSPLLSGGSSALSISALSISVQQVTATFATVSCWESWFMRPRHPRKYGEQMLIDRHDSKRRPWSWDCHPNLQTQIEALNRQRRITLSSIAGRPTWRHSIYVKSN